MIGETIMKKIAIGVQSSIWYNEKKPAESFKYIKECGFDAIDYGIADMFNSTWDKEKLTSFFDQSEEELFAYYKPMKDAAEENDISIALAHGLFPVYYPGEDTKNDYLIEVTKKMFAVCQYLGCKYIVLHPVPRPDLHKAVEKEYNLQFYRRLIPEAKKYHITICLENLFKHRDHECFEGACSDAYEACWYIDKLNEEAEERIFGLCLDVGHVNVAGRNLYQFITTLGDRIVTLHIHDNDGNSDSHLIPYTQVDRTGGRLSIEWENFIRGLKEIGYEGVLSFETAGGIHLLPEELRKSGFRFISDIGKYFRKRIRE